MEQCLHMPHTTCQVQTEVRIRTFHYLTHRLTQSEVESFGK